MADEKKDEKDDDGYLETVVGLMVVILATFLGIVNVKDNNIVQRMELMQADRINNWNWLQARNIRMETYESFANTLAIVPAGESPENAKAREKLIESFRAKASEQDKKMEDLKTKATTSEANYSSLNNLDDQFDLCEAALGIGLAMMGVTALMKVWWMFFVSMVPSAFGLFMGIAGFMGMDTSNPVVNWFIQLLS